MTIHDTDVAMAAGFVAAYLLLLFWGPDKWDKLTSISMFIIIFFTGLILEGHFRSTQEYWCVPQNYHPSPAVTASWKFERD